jgi:hypothetical protein
VNGSGTSTHFATLAAAAGVTVGPLSCK